VSSETATIPHFTLKSVNIRWYQRLLYVEIVLMPVRCSQNHKIEFEQLQANHLVGESVV
jgi:hypothetical protein